MERVVPQYIRISDENYKIWLEIVFPSLFVLYNAGWKNGYKVNGVSHG